jgi:hypothetical protein
VCHTQKKKSTLSKIIIMCCGDNGSGGFNRGGNSGYTWARWITTVIVALLFIGTAWASTRAEESGVIMTPKEGCILVTGNPADYLVKRGRRSDCYGETAVFWMDPRYNTSRIIYQDEDGALYCLADHCAGTRGKCDLDRVTLDLCDSGQSNQYWTRFVGKNKLVSAAALADPMDMRRCLSAAANLRTVLTGEDVLRMDICDDTGKSGCDQDWKFLDVKPTKPLKSIL